MKYNGAWSSLRDEIKAKIASETKRIKTDKGVMTAVDVSAKCAAYGNVLAMMAELGQHIGVSE